MNVGCAVNAPDADFHFPELFFLSCSTVAAAHALKLIRISAGANIVNTGKGRVEQGSYDVLERL
jgi:hypothetical protein